MKLFNLRTAALVALASSAFATYAAGEESAKSGKDQSGTAQSSANNSSKDQNQGTNNNNNANNSRADSDQNSKDSNNTQGQANQQKDQHQSKKDQTNQNKDGQSSKDPGSDRSSTSNTQNRDNSRDREDRDSARSDRDNRRDDRSNTRDRSSRDDGRNADNRSTSDRDRDSVRDRDSREHSSRRGNMRGPDIGIWFGRSSGVLVISDVSTRGPIAKLGFREGDRIVSVNGQRVKSEDEFIRYLLRSDSRRVTVIVLRDSREEKFYVEPAVLLQEDEYTEVDPLERFGIIVDDRYDDRIVVWRVIPRSPAYYAGFRPGDVIVKFGDRPYRTRTEFERGSRDWKAGDMNVQIRRGERTRDLSVEIPNRDQSDRRSERTERRDERTAQRDSAPSGQGNATDQSERKTDTNTNSNQGNKNRGGILNGIGRGNR